MIKMEDKDYIYKWLVGFIEGEGCFTFLTIDKQKWDVTPSFQLAVNIRDKEIIRKIHSLLGLGKIHYSVKDRSVRIRITKSIEIKQLISILNKYPFQTTKGQDYELWKRGVNLISSKRYKTEYGRNELEDLRKTINHYRTINPTQQLKNWIE